MPLRYELLLSAVLTVVIKAAVTALDGAIAWWLAALIALVVVFGGVLIFTSGSDSDSGSGGGGWDW